ncbi:MAG: hypothetical protein NTY19_28825 [Planctomycetota bacterium]|nr:hypothetical protein [Planctomycetota bacterium]
MSFSVFSASAIWAADGPSPGTLQVSDDARSIETAAQLPDLVPATGRELVTTPSTLQFVNSPGNTAGSSAASSGAVLRWRGRKPALETAAEASAPASAWQDRNTKTRGVRIVSHDEQGGDAFRDPFDDRVAQVSGPKSPSAKKSETTKPGQPKPEPPDLRAPKSQSAETEPPRMDSAFPALPTLDSQVVPSEPAAPAFDAPRPSTEPTEPRWKTPTTPATPDLTLPPAQPAEPLAPEQTPRATPEKPATDMDAPPAPPEEEKTSVAPSKPELKTMEPASRDRRIPDPLAASQDAADKDKCDRVYNFRNCCQEDKNCSHARTAVKNASIRKISLDITASIRPDVETPEAQQEALQAQLKQLPARVWKNRDGAVVADGRLTDIRNRRITVTQQDGQLAVVPLGQLCDDDICFLTAWWGVPAECSLGDEQFAGRSWEPVTMNWKASGLCHKPLYFEQVQLERYGHTVGPLLEAPLAGAHFFANIALLPYNMGIHPPQECQYALGYYRPGNCAPWLLPPFPLSLRGGLAEAGVIVGGAFLIP